MSDILAFLKQPLTGSVRFHSKSMLETWHWTEWGVGTEMKNNDPMVNLGRAMK